MNRLNEVLVALRLDSAAIGNHQHSVIKKNAQLKMANINSIKRR
jgi:hypothetical protein